ncbi:armadillo-like helical domain-containing protein [Chloropicon primus]|nr:armadillo-like helical domain-containing protein [Chloropicon primus]
MTGAERTASSALRWLRHQLRSWDKGDRTTRTKMLDEFISRHADETGPQLEKYYGNGASLFLTRISAWLKLTYLEGIALNKQLEAVSIFLSAANGTRYLAEFVDFGGLLSILDLLSIKDINEEDKCSALGLLLQIAHAGRFYKELICSFNGMQVTVGLLEAANFPHTRLLIYDVFLVLGSGNPKYSNKVQAEIIAMISTRNIHALRLGMQAIRRLVCSSTHMHVIQASSRGHTHNNLLQLIDKTIPLLGSPDFEVQYEAFELVQSLCMSKSSSVGVYIVNSLYKLLIKSSQELDRNVQLHLLMEKENEASPVDIAQATAAKILYQSLHRLFENEEVKEEVMTERYFRAILSTIANERHYESRQHAANLFETLTTLDMEKSFALTQELAGDELMYLLCENPQRDLESKHLDALRLLGQTAH